MSDMDQNKPIEKPKENNETMPARTEKRPGSVSIYPIMALILALAGFAVYQYSVITDKTRAITTLEQRNEQHVEEKEQLNAYIEEVTSEIGDIADRLKTLRERRVTLTTLAPEAETDSAIRTRILTDIADIESQLVNDQRSLDALEKRMTESSIKITALEEMVTALKAEITESRETIAALTETVELRDLALAQTRDSLYSTQQNLFGKEQELSDTRSTAYYAVGTAKELEAKNVIDRFGFFRKRNVLTADFDPSAFQPVNRNSVEHFTIECDSDDIKVVPARSDSSYSLEEIEKGRTVLTVVDREKFWQMPYLVVVMD